MYIGNLVLLGLVILMGEEGNGAQRWLKIGGLQFQPSELAKILLILFFAQFIMKYKEKLNTFPVIASIAVLMGVPWIMVKEQPALSTSLVLIFIFCVILYAGGISYKLIFGALAVAIPAVIILVSLAMQPDSTILETYQKNRILAFVNPEEYSTDLAYQQLNSVMAIGSGELDGKGYKNNEITSVKNGNFLSEAETDFIFAVIGEEFGFKGSIVVIILLMLMAMECVSIAGKAKDTAGTIIAASMGGTDRFPELCEHRSGYVYFTEYRTSAAFCKLWPDLADESVYWNGCCTERTITGEEKLDKRNHTLHREGVWTI